jgi:hypothetical protein
MGHRTHGVQQFGWTIDGEGNRVEVGDEQSVLHQVKLAKRGRSYQQTADHLNDNRIPTVSEVRGKQRSPSGWRAGTVHRLLAR